MHKDTCLNPTDRKILCIILFWRIKEKFVSKNETIGFFEKYRDVFGPNPNFDDDIDNEGFKVFENILNENIESYHKLNSKYLNTIFGNLSSGGDRNLQADKLKSLFKILLKDKKIPDQFDLTIHLNDLKNLINNNQELKNIHLLKEFTEGTYIFNNPDSVSGLNRDMSNTSQVSTVSYSGPLKEFEGVWQSFLIAENGKVRINYWLFYFDHKGENNYRWRIERTSHLVNVDRYIGHYRIDHETIPSFFIYTKGENGEPCRSHHFQANETSGNYLECQGTALRGSGKKLKTKLEKEFLLKISDSSDFAFFNEFLENHRLKKSINGNDIEFKLFKNEVEKITEDERFVLKITEKELLTKILSFLKKPKNTIRRNICIAKFIHLKKNNDGEPIYNRRVIKYNGDEAFVNNSTGHFIEYNGRTQDIGVNIFSEYIFIKNIHYNETPEKHIFYERTENKNASTDLTLVFPRNGLDRDISTEELSNVISKREIENPDSKSFISYTSYLNDFSNVEVKLGMQKRKNTRVGITMYEDSDMACLTVDFSSLDFIDELVLSPSEIAYFNLESRNKVFTKKFEIESSSYDIEIFTEKSTIINELNCTIESSDIFKLEKGIFYFNFNGELKMGDTFYIYFKDEIWDSFN